MRVTCLILMMLSLTVQTACQVRVSASLTKAEYLEGEPIEVIVKITNVGSDPVAYQKGSGHVALEVEGQEKRPVPPNLWGCFAGEGRSAGAGGIDHPPLLLPAASTEFKYLLRDYQLHSGQYTLRASGRAGVRWKFYGDNHLSRTRRFHEGDTVPGADFNQTLALRLRVGTESELRRAYGPYIAEASTGSLDRGYEARDAISEMAPAFLEKAILGFANYQDGAGFATRGLSRIDTAEARNDLVDLFDRTSDLGIRGSIVHALAEMNSGDQLKFFASLLPGQVSSAEDEIRQYAILALGRVGGDHGVEVIRQFLSIHGAEASPRTRSVSAIALASGKSRKAIPILIGMYGDSNGEVQNSVCGSLLSLTHMSWCDGSGDVSKLQAEWRRWWSKDQSAAKIYGTNACPTLDHAPSLPTE
ncbi:MAG TPA: HEAT repeat domain-containing protein [Edaphobacter sp.]|nr:HEAT repeat domain-containing protein [Edaphobacter sp.]